MSEQQDIDRILEDDHTGLVAESAPVTEKDIQAALQEVATVLSTTGQSLTGICATIEGASSKEECRLAFRQFNNIIQMVLAAAPNPESDEFVGRALCSLEPGSSFTALLRSHDSVGSAISAYKVLVLKNLSMALRRGETTRIVSEEQDNALFDQFFTAPAKKVQAKRGASAVIDPPELTVIPKKRRSSVPALAALEDITSGEVVTGVAKKRILLTRDMLRAAEDTRGLLNLEDRSTNALDRTKTLELMKSAGYDFSHKSKSFSDRLHSAALRLEYGMGGQSIDDTLLFGGKVLSLPLPGFLTKKNVSDIQNNVVSEKTSWKHQDAYVKMLIAGFMNQSKRILNNFDQVLYAKSPVECAEDTHKAIARLLASKEVLLFQGKVENNEEPVDPRKVKFIKKVVGAVSPILPIVIRDKSLDGSYLRTALHLLGSAEFLFAQYDSDIRGKANPAGAVNMCHDLHAEIKRTAVCSLDLKPHSEFMRELKAQYQTSLGLGSSFRNDISPRDRRRGRASRGFQGRQGRNWMQQPQPLGPGAYGDRMMGQNNMFRSYGRGQLNPVPVRGAGVCYAFQAGTCGRGDSCRFRHPRS